MPDEMEEHIQKVAAGRAEEREGFCSKGVTVESPTRYGTGGVVEALSWRRWKASSDQGRSLLRATGVILWRACRVDTVYHV